MNEDVPELPVRHETRENALGEVLWEDVHGPYSAEDMIAYGRACFRAGMERAVVICDKREKGWDEDPPDGVESVYDHRRDEAKYCAAAIRAEIEAQPRA